MIEFLYGFLAGCIIIIGIAALDIKLFKDKMINKKIADYRIYLFYTSIEIAMFIIGYLVGIKQ